MAVPVIMMTVRDWTMRLLFVRGAFDLAAAEAAAAILTVYAIGLVPAFAIRSLVAGFHGRGDTCTPLRMQLLATVVNIAVKTSFAPSVGALNLALGTTTGITVHASLLWRTVMNRGFVTGLRFSDMGIVVASGIAASLLVLCWRSPFMNSFAPMLGQWSLPIALIALSVAVVAVQAAATVFVPKKIQSTTPQ
jgi:putative peptidoglycan lipid II flippase